MADHEAIIARGHAALTIGQSLLPPTESGSKNVSAKVSGLKSELNASLASLEASQDEHLKATWKWNDMDDEADIANLVKESGLRILDVVEAVWEWQSLQGAGGSNIDHKEFLLTLTERKHLRILISFIPTRVTLPQVKEYLLSSVDTMKDLESTETISFRNLTTRLLRLITLPPSSTGTDLHSFLSAPTVLPFILLPPLLLGWTQAFPPPTFSDIRKAFLEYLDEQLGPGDAMSTLGGISTIMTSRRKSQTSAKIVPVDEEDFVYPDYAKRTVRALMGRQLIRKGGVAGLLGNVFGAGERNDGKTSNDVLELHKLDYVTRLLAVPVHGMTPKEFNDNIFEQIRTIIVPTDPTSVEITPQHHVRAAAYVLGQHSVTIPACRQNLQHSLHAPLFPDLDDLPHSFSPSSESTIITRPNDVNSLLSLLLPLLTLNPPPPPFLDLVITPILSPLFLLWQYLEQDKTADPLTRKELEDVIAAWIRLMDVAVVEKGLWDVLNGGRGWKVAGMGGLAVEAGDVLFWDKMIATGEEEEDAGVAVFFGRPPSSTDEDLKLAADPIDFNLATKLSDATTKEQETQSKHDDQDLDILPDLSSLQLWPDPELLVSAVENSGRPELSSRFFVRCLQAYQDRSTDETARPETTLLLLQVIMRLSDKVSANLGKEVQHVLLFIEHALRAPGDSSEEVDQADSEDGADSDDEDVDDAEEATVADLTKDDVPNLGLVETALNLLVATLHGNANITSDSQPIIKPIEKHVERLNKHRLANIRQAAKTASLLLAVRKAMPTSGSASAGSDTAQRYQEALKLLQDPILAVRAHGLMILQSIVRAPDFDHALIPAIMDIFLSAIRDDDSFMYLNAIKGLSSLVDGIGAEVMNSISKAYVEGLDRNIDIKADELDRRLRLGEALQQSIRRAGAALSGYIRPIVPRLLRVFPNKDLPTVIRSSSLSILATCADTEWRSLLPWSDDLIASCLDLLRLESVSYQPKRVYNPPNEPNEEEEEQDNENEPTTNEPTRTNDSKHPALRRAALVFLGLMFDAIAEATAEASEAQSTRHPEIRITTTRHSVSAPSPAAVDPSLIASAKTVLNYIKHTDVDSLAAHQAGEVVQILRQLPI